MQAAAAAIAESVCNRYLVVGLLRRKFLASMPQAQQGTRLRLQSYCSADDDDDVRTRIFRDSGFGNLGMQEMPSFVLRYCHDLMPYLGTVPIESLASYV